MGYANFQPMVWSVGINRELERLMVFAEDCNREYEGQVKNKGESVKILGVGKPTIKTIAKSARNNDIDGAEEIEDTSVIMNINQIRYFNYMVGDIDKAQSVSGLMNALQGETSEALADSIDTYIAALATDESIKKLNSTAVKVTKDNVLAQVNAALVKLYENDVKSTAKIVVTVSPRFYDLFRQAYEHLDTNNSAELKNGKVGMYHNVTVKMSNNVATTSNGAVDNILIRTQKAIAFANPLTHTEAYRPESKFADAIKGFALFDAKVVRPKEAININVKYTD